MISFAEKFRQHARERPEALAIRCGGDTLTHAELDRRSNRMARSLANLGVSAGDLVTVGLRNGVGFLEACHAIWKLGAVPQPVSYRLPQPELRAIVDLAHSPVVIGDFDVDVGRPVVGLSALREGSIDEGSLPDRTSPNAKAPTSGGSTGRPKLILSGQPGETAAETPEAGPYGLSPTSVVLIPAPLYHNAGFTVMMQASLLGASVVVTPRFDPAETLAEIERSRATWVYLVPTMMNRIWRLPSVEREAFDLSSLQTAWHTSAPCPVWLKSAFIGWLSHVNIMELYAGTEGQARTIIGSREWLEHPGSVGRVAAGEIVIFGDDGSPCPPGEVGEIFMRPTPGAAPTYAYRGADAKTLPGGWESLGDMGWFDADGYLFLADRRADMILVGGANVYPAEVEAALEAHPAVRSCAVIGLPDEDLGARVYAIVNLAEEVSEEVLRDHMRERLVTYKLPRTYEFTSEPVRDEAGKVRRSALREARLDPARGQADDASSEPTS